MPLERTYPTCIKEEKYWAKFNVAGLPADHTQQDTRIDFRKSN